MLKQVDIKDAKSRGGIVLLVCASQGDKRKKGRMSVERLKVSSTMVKRAFALTFTQHAGDCERYGYGQAVTIRSVLYAGRAYHCPTPKVECQEHLQEISSLMYFSSLIRLNILCWMLDRVTLYVVDEEAPERQMTSGISLGS